MAKITKTLIAFLISTTFGFSTIVVGTTGDYAPFSIYKDGKFYGKDIKLIKQFAKSKKQNIKFFKTTWKDSGNDLANGKFDVFVGGITRNPAREKLFVFSKDLLEFNKAAMTQCQNVDKYKSFDDIDNSKSLIIENHGGTNEQFALQNIKKANILITPSNILAIESLTKGINGIYPNVMFTDNDEITYQHKINPKLCQIPIKVDNSISYKAFMFNKTEKGKSLAKQFNQWLNKNSEIFQKYKNV